MRSAWYWAGSQPVPPGRSISAAASAIRARPPGVRCAAVSAARAAATFATGSLMPVSTSRDAGRATAGSPARAISALNVTARSRLVFQKATDPPSTPHIASPPANSCGCCWSMPAVISPPIESPQATVARGAPNARLKRPSTAC